MENSNYIWVTPDPMKVKRMIAICEGGRAIECYLGEKWFIHKTYLSELKTYGFIECDGYVKCFDTPEEAEMALDKFKIVTR